MTDFNWKAWKQVFASKGNDLRKHMQSGLLFGMQQYKEHGNSNYLTQAITLGHTAGYRDRQLINFVVDHAKSLVWKDKKLSTMVIEEVKQDHANAVIPVVNWWSYKKPPITVVVDPDGRVLSLIKVLENAQEKGNTKKVWVYDLRINMGTFERYLS